MEDIESFKIFVDQLRDGHIAKLDEKISAAFLEVDEKDLSFRDPVTVQGEVYLAGDELVLHLALRAVYVVPCVICNAPVEVEISLPSVYEAVPLEQVPHGIFSIQTLVREAILLEIKPFAECHNGACPQRQDIARYLKQESQTPPSEEGISPFDELERKDFEA